MANQDLKTPDVDKTQSDSQNTLTGIVESVKPFTSTKEVNSKEIVIALGALLVIAIIFFFIKNYLSKMLVASYKKSPRSADMAGWSLFCILFFAAVGAVLGILNSAKFLSLPYLIPIGLAILSSLIAFIIALTSKR